MREIEIPARAENTGTFLGLPFVYTCKNSGARRREDNMVRALRIHLLVVVVAALTAAALTACGGAG